MVLFSTTMPEKISLVGGKMACTYLTIGGNPEVSIIINLPKISEDRLQRACEAFNREMATEENNLG